MGKRRESLGELYELCNKSSYNCSSYAEFTVKKNQYLKIFFLNFRIWRKSETPLEPISTPLTTRLPPVNSEDWTATMHRNGRIYFFRFWIILLCMDWCSRGIFSSVMSGLLTKSIVFVPWPSTSTLKGQGAVTFNFDLERSTERRPWPVWTSLWRDEVNRHSAMVRDKCI